ncbi:MAG: hypothetical protein V1928_03345 [Parcubacteria group bacterium]
MHNWSINTKDLKKNKKQYAIWRLEQTANFGLTGKKISKQELKKFWPSLRLDPRKKKYFKTLLWPKRS